MNDARAFIASAVARRVAERRSAWSTYAERYLAVERELPVESR
jgi:hypothetical protein